MNDNTVNIEVQNSQIERSALDNSSLEKKAIELTQALVRFPSITPNDAGSFDFLVSRLKQAQFQCYEVMEQGVRNLVAVRRFGPGPTLAFAGHLDVVPTGASQLWLCPPFAGEILGERLYGRGVVDMKGGVACFIAAMESQIESFDQGALMYLITCDEEGEAEYGTRVLMDYIRQHHPELIPQYCLVGEPSCKRHLGDTIKIGRRGSLSGRLRVYGQQGHVAYPHLCDNAAHHAVTLAQQLLLLEWDKGSIEMPGTSLQITQLNSGDFCDNVVPGLSEVAFNIRYSAKYTEQTLKKRLLDALHSTGRDFEIQWQRPCEPYFNEASQFVLVLQQAIDTHLGIRPTLSTDGGTSDGRFIASDDTQVIEFGLKNDTIHQVNESADIVDIGLLAKVYLSVIEGFCCSGCCKNKAQLIKSNVLESDLFDQQELSEQEFNQQELSEQELNKQELEVHEPC